MGSFPERITGPSSLLVSKVRNAKDQLITRTRKMMKNDKDDRKKLSTPVMQVNYVDYCSLT